MKKLPWKDIAGIGALLIIIFLVIKYVPLDPTKKEVIKEQEEIIHYEEESSLEIDKETITVITPNNNLEITSPSFDILKADEDGLVIAGRAKKFSEVTILRGDEVIAKVQANQFGEFVYITEEPLNPGTYELRLLADGIESKENATIMIPKKFIETVEDIVPSKETAEDIVSSKDDQLTEITKDITPSIDESLIESGKEEQLIVIQDEEGAVKKVIQGATDSSEVLEEQKSLTFDALSYTPEGTLKLSGKAQPGSRVEVYIDGNRVGWGITDDDGWWNITFGKPIKAGDYVLRFNQFVNEKIISSIDTPVSQPDYSTIESIDENTVVVQPGNSLWRISRRFYGRGIMYTLIFKANNSHINDPDLIYPGQIFKVPEEISE